MRALAATALLLVATGLSACNQPDSSVVISEARLRPLLPGRDVTAGHMLIQGGSTDDSLMGARSDATDVIELHSMERDGDISRMRRVDVISVPRGETVSLEPGGLHLMLFGLTPEEIAGGLPVTLTFEKAGDMTLVFEVPEPN